jgi:multidrug efflux pump subunit AcrA (membrane-fusion protein)
MTVKRSKSRLLWAGLVTILVAAPVGLALVPQTRPATLAALDTVGLGGTARKLLRASPAGADVPAARATSPAPVAAAPAVTVVEAQLRPFRDQIFVSGTLVAREEALVGAQVDGLRIDAVLAEDGDRVREGQVLARLDRSQLEALVAGSDAAIARADAAIAQAQSQILQFQATGGQAIADYNRAKQLGPGVLSQATLDQRLAAARAPRLSSRAPKARSRWRSRTARARTPNGGSWKCGSPARRSGRRSRASSAGARPGSAH